MLVVIPSTREGLGPRLWIQHLTIVMVNSISNVDVNINSPTKINISLSTTLNILNPYLADADPT